MAILHLLPLCLVLDSMCVVLGQPCGATDWESEDTGGAHLGHCLPTLEQISSPLCFNFLICKMGEGTGSESPC